MKAVANASPIADADETSKGEDLFMTPRTRERFQRKIRLWVNYSVKTLRSKWR